MLEGPKPKQESGGYNTDLSSAQIHANGLEKAAAGKANPERPQPMEHLQQLPELQGHKKEQADVSRLKGT